MLCHSWLCLHVSHVSPCSTLSLSLEQFFFPSDVSSRFLTVLDTDHSTDVNIFDVCTLRCLWKDGVSVLTAEPKKTRLAPREIGTEPWVDPDFPPTKENVGLEIWEKKSSPTWTRLSEIRDNPVLFNEEDPFDIDQGGLGNCWLIGTMAALAEYQPYLRDHIFVSKDVPPDGRYQIRLFDIKERDWVIHEVDDLVPCHKESSTVVE